MTKIAPSVENAFFTLQAVSMSATALRLRLAVAITSSCRQEFPAATALAVAMVMPFVIRIDSSGDEDFSGTSFNWNTWMCKKGGRRGKDERRERRFMPCSLKSFCSEVD